MTIIDARIYRAEALQGAHFTLAAFICAPRCRTREQTLLSEISGYDRFSLRIHKAFGMLEFSTPNLGEFRCAVVDDGRWHHIALVLDGPELRFYRDAQLLYTFDAPGGMMGTKGHPVVGSEVDGSFPYYGQIENVRVENRTYSEQELRDLAYTRPAEAPPAPISRIPPAPLYEDPVFNSAKDGTIVWNPVEKNWWFIYMQIRNGANEPGVSVHHGTTIGASSSPDGLVWSYRGILRGLEDKPGANTFWAPEILWHDGRFHGYFSYVRGIHSGWEGDRVIRHYISDDLLHWSYENDLEGLGSCRCLDCCVYPLPDGQWGMWFKDEILNQTGFATGKTLSRFQLAEYIDPGTPPLEGCDVFFWKGFYWMMGDDCYSYNGQRVYRSEEARQWTRCDNILVSPGKRPFDENVAHHPEIVLNPETDEAYIFYWVLAYPSLPYSANEICCLQVARLQYEDGQLRCDRDEEFSLILPGRV